jgi:hypothetical protein
MTTMGDDMDEGEAPMRMVNRPVTPIPRRMLNLPRDSRGIPIPWFAGRDADGYLHVTILDGAR